VPRYYYKCDACNDEFEVRHGMSETQTECLKCSSTGLLTRIPQLIQRVEIRDNKSTAKDRVTSAIEENRETLKKMKKQEQTYDID
jgi:putative FmdB family regulatory protein